MQLIEIHDGKVTVESKLGEDSGFSIYLRCSPKVDRLNDKNLLPKGEYFYDKKIKNKQDFEGINRN